jgi:hypothetical protein
VNEALCRAVERWRAVADAHLAAGTSAMGLDRNG